MAEDRRVTLAALAVTAIVGVGAPIATVIATNAHDSHRLHREQVQADRTELRAVLDVAAASLDSVSGQLRAATRAALQGHHELIVRPAPARQIALLRGALIRASESYDRLAIRVGRLVPAAKRLNDALAAADQWYFDLLAGDLRSNVALDSQYSIRRDAFVDAANALARSLTS